MRSIQNVPVRLTVTLMLVLFGTGLLRAGRAQEARPYSGPVAALAAAVWNERTAEVERLLAAGENPDTPAGSPAMTPWQIAVFADHRPSLALFDRRGPRPREHYTPALFKTVLMRGDAALVAEFVRAGVPLEFGDAEYSALGVAAANGFVDVMRILVDAKANVNRQDRFGDTALMAAVRGGRLDAVALLLRSGADLSLRDADGRTALTWAQRIDRADVVSALRRAGAAPGEPSIVPAASHPLPSLRTAPSAAWRRSSVVDGRGTSAGRAPPVIMPRCWCRSRPSRSARGSHSTRTRWPSTSAGCARCSEDSRR